jgi:hypothetical protein
MNSYQVVMSPFNPTMQNQIVQAPHNAHILKVTNKDVMGVDTCYMVMLICTTEYRTEARYFETHKTNDPFSEKNGVHPLSGSLTYLDTVFVAEEWYHIFERVNYFVQK